MIWSTFDQEINRSIQMLQKNSIVLEIGAGANPLISRSQIDQLSLQYFSTDIDGAELEKSSNFTKEIWNVEDGPFRISADLIISRTVIEHISDNDKAFRHIYQSLKDNGKSIHLFPTLFTLPAIVNKIIPERISSWILQKFRPRDRFHYGKFKAFYHHCYGPTKGQIQWLHSLGFTIEKFYGSFGHRYYKKFALLSKLEQWKSRWLLKKQWPMFCANAVLVIQKNNVK